MLFPFRHSSIFRNRWIAVLWAAGICFMASEIVDSLSSVAQRGGKPATIRPADNPDPNKAGPSHAETPAMPPLEDRIVR